MILKRFLSSTKCKSVLQSVRVINNKIYETDSYTNLSPKVISLLNKKLYKTQYHPICLLTENIKQFFYKKFVNRRGNAVFSVHDDLDPVVTVDQNFNSLLVPDDHPSRVKSECYYLNENLLLRAHMTAHQSDLIGMGFDNFLMVGDVYRRDTIDVTHYPVFHQLDAVRLLSPTELLRERDDGMSELSILDTKSYQRTKQKQECYTLEACQMIEKELKSTLEMLSQQLFGPEIQYKWVEAYFPFTHPSWELELFLNGKWVEMLGCGIIEHKILEKAGCKNKIGWAFGLGLERLAMVYYSIPDIRLFWSEDPGFINQFNGKKYNDKITFKPISIYPASEFDISFWVNDNFNENDFYEIAREVCGNDVEFVSLIDTYKCKKTGRESYCFRLRYRSMEKTFTKAELKELHETLENVVASKLNVTIR